MSATPPGYDGLPPELDPRGPRGRRGGPGRARERRRTGAAQVLSVLAAVVSVCVLVTTVGLYAVYRHYDGNIHRIDVFGQLGKHQRPASDAAQNFLLVGSDSRAGQDGSFQAKPGSADYVTGQRSDTTILVHIPAGSAKATVISFPRDSYVEIPEFTKSDGTVVPAHHEKLNAAFSEGGPPLLTALIENLSGLRIDHFLQVDFVGFKNMVNALGGVTVCVGTTRHDHDSGDYLTAGSHQINGDQALAFVRDRKGLPRGDLDRIADQQYFLSVLLHKVLSAGTLTNPLKLNAFLDAATKSVTADKQFDLSAMKTLATRMRNVDPAHVTFLTIPVADAGGSVPGVGSVVILDMDKLAQMFAALRGDSVTAPSAAPISAQKLVVAPSQVKVRVYNGVGTAGLAGRARAALEGIGFDVVSTGNRGTGATTTTVFFGRDKADSARTLAAAVPGAVTQEQDSLGSTLEIVLGTTYNGVKAVHVGGSSAQQPTTGGSSKPSTGSTGAAKPTTPPATAASVSCAP